MKKLTILEATKQWVGGFNAINQSLISRLMKHEADDWNELTKPSVGLYAYYHGEATNVKTQEEEHISGSMEITSIGDDVATVEYEGNSYEIEISELDVDRDSILPMWGTMWTFGESLDEEWVRENLQTVSDCGFRIYEDDGTGDIYIGIDGMGYDFYEAHWLPLYKARGLQWHTPIEEENK